MKNLVITLLTLVLSSYVFADTEQLLRITNGRDKSVSHFGVHKNERGDVTGFYETVVIAERQYSKTYEYELSKLESGIVISKSDGRNVVTLRADNYSSHNGGIIKIVYLYNGIRNTYKTMEINIMRDGDNWEVWHTGDTIKGLHMHLHYKPIIGVVGISHITTSK